MTPSSKWMLYMLRCRDGTLYTGITTDLERRLQQHNAGTASKYTRVRLPVQLCYSEKCRDESHAKRRECAVKSLSRTNKEALFD